MKVHALRDKLEQLVLEGAGDRDVTFEPSKPRGGPGGKLPTVQVTRAPGRIAIIYPVEAPE